MTNGKLPWLQFFTGDWKKDPAVSACSPATRGIWMDALCAMHEDEQKGELVGTLASLARVCRCTPAQMRAALAELERTGAAVIVHMLTNEDKMLTLRNRRMYSAWTRRNYKTVKQQGYRWTKRRHESGQAEEGYISEVRSQRSNTEPKEAAAVEVTQVRGDDDSKTPAAATAAAVRGHWVLPEDRTDMPFHLTTEEQDAWGEIWCTALRRKRPWGALTVQQREKLNHFARWVQQHYPDEVPSDLFKRVAKLVGISELKHHGRIDIALRSDELLDSWIQQAIHGDVEPESDTDRYRRAAEKAGQP